MTERLKEESKITNIRVLEGGPAGEFPPRPLPGYVHIYGIMLRKYVCTVLFYFH